MYAQGIVALSPYLEDPYLQHGYKHYYDPESSSGYIAWRLKTIQRKAVEERSVSVCKSPKSKFTYHLNDTDVICRQDSIKHLSMFCIFALQIEQDFRLLFCEVTGSKFLERWLTNLKAKVVKESHGLVPTSELLELMCNAESGWDSDLSTILLLLHLLPPSAQGRKRPGKMSASQAVNNLIKFPKAGTSVQQHLGNITRSSQPYHLTQGSTRSSIHTFIVIEKHALPCKARGSVGALDELFRAHYVFGTSYSSSLTNFVTFLQLRHWGNVILLSLVSIIEL
ncbi:uncharacterized protein LOC120721984 isoform X1 [Simochromis diagramma]|uniref:uncharacterized protein LOC120721984 isoform X1 n=2 Tax=Simochromis diagramma TaxID=43689 RepID=UPI001A7E932E|nr:uncharacterized protein LOC120721984 isoform X1 [Simochromis diagramma]XP_039868607.1 uncharacterized protein LOC120721984 isoform X1 [Simochromis diagramma]XP_039868608.1 uncharacterized protein LOC120721984 isoform X1 [Simochromis diagramma]